MEEAMLEYLSQDNPGARTGELLLIDARQH